MLERFDLRLLLEQSVTLNRLLAQKKQIQVIYECDEKLPRILADAGKIQQVLDNLFSNAIKFSYPQTTIQLRAVSQQDRILISVRDEGQGIPANEVEQLFLPFAKISVRATAGEPSSRMGLAIVFKLVRGHQGEIWVESEVGKGSTFHVLLPIEPDLAAIVKADTLAKINISVGS